MTAVELTIAARFKGPPDSGHGGYAAGLVAGLLGGPVRVRLRRPPPLGRGLTVRREGEGVTLVDGDEVIASGAPVTVDVTLPDPVGFGEAEAAAREYPGFRGHVFPGCFGCGPDRAAGDGLRIFPGPVPGRALVAAPWIPDRSLTGDRGGVRPEFLWAALDCPSGWAPIVAGGGPPSVLGEIAARVVSPVRVGEHCVVLGWALGGEGRKSFAGSAILGQDGAVRAVARATWIAIAPR